ncbi:MAG: hypothetical protein JWP12_1392 [Bacteroidetes bacterium]|nr:hypothetical protein [Bacteroidota bacterium]
MEPKEDIQDKITEKYLEQLYKIYDSSIVTLDKNILYISSSALGLSLTFLKNIIDTSSIKCFFILSVSWVLLTLSILLSLLLHKNSIKLINYLIVNVYQQKEGEDLNAKKMRKNAELLNAVAIWFLITGILLLVVFVLINLKK